MKKENDANVEGRQKKRLIVKKTEFEVPSPIEKTNISFIEYVLAQGYEYVDFQWSDKNQGVHVDPNGAWVKNVDGLWRTLQSKEALPKKSYFRV